MDILFWLYGMFTIWWKISLHCKANEESYGKRCNASWLHYIVPIGQPDIWTFLLESDLGKQINTVRIVAVDAAMTVDVEAIQLTINQSSLERLSNLNKGEIRSSLEVFTWKIFFLLIPRFLWSNVCVWLNFEKLGYERYSKWRTYTSARRTFSVRWWRAFIFGMHVPIRGTTQRPKYCLQTFHWAVTIWSDHRQRWSIRRSQHEKAGCAW